MSEHPSHPDQLMARALGVCWHSPTADRWPCQEQNEQPLACWEKQLVTSPGEVFDCALPQGHDGPCQRDEVTR